MTKFDPQDSHRDTTDRRADIFAASRSGSTSEILNTIDWFMCSWCVEWVCVCVAGVCDVCVFGSCVPRVMKLTVVLS